MPRPPTPMADGPLVPLPLKASGHPGRRGLRGRLLLHVNGYTTKWGRRGCSTVKPGVLLLWRERDGSSEPCALDLAEAVVTPHPAHPSQFFVASRTWGIVRLKAPLAHVAAWIQSIEDSIACLRAAHLCVDLNRYTTAGCTHPVGHACPTQTATTCDPPAMGIPLGDDSRSGMSESDAGSGLSEGSRPPLEALLAALRLAVVQQEKDAGDRGDARNSMHDDRGGGGEKSSAVMLRRGTWDAIRRAFERMQGVQAASHVGQGLHDSRWLGMAEASQILREHAHCLSVPGSPPRASAPAGAHHLRGASLWATSPRIRGADDGTAEWALADAQHATEGAGDQSSWGSGSDTPSDVSERGAPRSTPRGPPAYDVSECISDWERDTLPAFPTFKSKGLWSIIKNKLMHPSATMSLPACFNSPQSSLQRASEEMEHARLLTLAAQLPRSLDRLAYVAVWCCTHYSTVPHRPSKPFNPLLGETFELEGSLGRDEGHAAGGFRYVTEKVAHNPTCGAYACCDTQGLWRGWGDFTLRTSLGTTRAVVGFDGMGRLDFPATGDAFAYTKGNSVVTGILSGDVRVDLAVDFAVENHATGERAEVSIKGSTVSGRICAGTRGFSGRQESQRGTSWPCAAPAYAYALEGTVCGHIDVVPLDPEVIASCPAHPTTPRLPGHALRLIPAHRRHCVWIGNGTPNPRSTPYGMGRFASNTNRLTCAMLGTLPVTDSRWRPDIRMLEFSDVVAADRWKDALEAAQRKRREANAEALPRWFTRATCALTGRQCWEPTGEYWPARDKGPSAGGEAHADLMLAATPSAWPSGADPRLVLLPRRV